ncbi:hypothetical protein VAR608DRAFT_4871 [Variovorax sp. HW608]|uniref:hypothetical protein n=1 Tax=Variovorax sp. HW608 TaxID=1034889 RepID=UPI00081F9F38|nr:hypothetical protein [Variovorax sp. HW608]SCK49013.1 hypothetical protein VAR608DRAFT_4871 [Variovorax sp. HW608]
MLSWAEFLDWVQYFNDREQDRSRAAARAKGEIRTDDPNAVQALLKASGAAARKPRARAKETAAPAAPSTGAPSHG